MLDLQNGCFMSAQSDRESRLRLAATKHFLRAPRVVGAQVPDFGTARAAGLGRSQVQAARSELPNVRARRSQACVWPGDRKTGPNRTFSRRARKLTECLQFLIVKQFAPLPLGCLSSRLSGVARPVGFQHKAIRFMSVGGESGIGFSTMRGRNYPSIRQFTVFMENRVGQLLEVIRRFEGSKVRIVALSINDSSECAFVRFLLSHPEQGREILERAGLALIESDLIGVELPEGNQPLLQVCTALLQAEVNIIQAYPLLVRPRGRPAVALMVDNIEMGLETLDSKGFTMITEADLANDE